MLYHALRPALFRFDPESAHRLTIAALKALPTRAPTPDPALAIRVAGLDFPNPVGLAAGFDKDAKVPDAMLALGFGFVEVGTLTPLPQPGNPKPRLFRLTEDRAVINRLGFNNHGQGAAAARLRARAGRGGVVGVNIGANKDAADRIADYAEGVRRMSPVADYLTVNISSPNTPGLRTLQAGDALADLLAAVGEARAPGSPPLFLKIAPDLSPTEINAMVATAGPWVDGLIVANTTVTRPSLRSPHANEAGGLSGAPLSDLALARLRAVRAAAGPGVPLIAVGGIASAADAYARLRAGASLVQLYTALIYEGPGLARRITRDLKALLKRDGFATVAAAVGVEV